MVDLRLFVSIAETNSLRRGAERSHLSAPAASARIRHLEDAIGSKLLVRTRQGITLTPPGQAFLHHAKVVLLELEGLGRDLEEYSPNLRGILRMAANPAVVEEYLPDALRHYRGTHADVRLDVRELLSPEIVRALTAGTADVGVISNHVRTEDLEVIDYRETRLALIVPADHPLAARERVAFAEILDEDFVDFGEFSPTHAFTHRKFAARHPGITVRVQVTNADASCRMVAANVGVAIVPRPAAYRHARSMPIRVVELSDEDAALRFQIVARRFKMLPTYARDLIDLLLEQRDVEPSNGEAAMFGPAERVVPRK
jgi:DNA-binding transcriptional LysR family regulator